MAFHELTFNIDWDRIIIDMVQLSKDKQLFFANKIQGYEPAYRVEIGMVSLGTGRQSGQTDAVIRYAKRNNFLVITGTRHETDLTLKEGLKSIHIDEMLNNGHSPSIAGLKFEGIIVDASGMPQRTPQQIAYAVQRALLQVKAVNPPIVVIG